MGNICNPNAHLVILLVQLYLVGDGKMTYKCGSCNRTFNTLGEHWRCPYCGGRIIFKTRKRGVKVVRDVRVKGAHLPF